MTNINYPNEHTEEEEALLAKYAKLKKKRKQLAVLKAPKIEKQESISELTKKPQEAAFDATEKAKQLLKLGAIKVGAEKKEQVTFKRKRQKETEGPKTAVSFQPFSPLQGSSSSVDKGDDATPTPPIFRSKLKYSLYDNFVPSTSSATAQGDEGTEIKRENSSSTACTPGGTMLKKGNTIYIFGYGLTEDLIRRVFGSVGKVINVSMEPGKNCSFVTFDAVEAADRAVAEMNGSLVSGGIQLKVSLARNQPSVENFIVKPEPAAPPKLEPPLGGGHASESWSTMAASNSQKGSHKDQRELVTYGEDTDIF